MHDNDFKQAINEKKNDPTRLVLDTFKVNRLLTPHNTNKITRNDTSLEFPRKSLTNFVGYKTM